MKSRRTFSISVSFILSDDYLDRKVNKESKNEYTKLSESEKIELYIAVDIMKQFNFIQIIEIVENLKCL